MPREYRPALDDPNAYVLYRYRPSQVAAIIFIVAFGLTTFAHIFQLIRKRTWYFIPLVVGGICEFVGYIGRVMSHENMWALVPFIVQSCLILVAPALFAASIYIILGRIILLVDGERYSLVPQKWLTKMFVTGDIISFMLQGAGAGIQAKGNLKSMELGEKIIIGGLVAQLMFFGFFVAVAGMFHYRLVNDRPLKKRLGPTSSRDAGLSRPALSDLPWKRHLFNLYFASGLIMLRSVFRVVEYVGGNAGYLLSNEVFLYIFDSVLMFFVMVSFNWIHPGQVTEAYQKRIRSSSPVELHRRTTSL
ncbi:RTA1-domain-containing protein [Decorospora gaudefroyi]|uniref:RTA1-domain-containing protein n=1 Tax=Decorospora gaudefroyi TaxID=184978 RepID=A0A6A5KYL9_9PLEO|nr:RTA1-domain-containing protein [Decorospora gaudefroyi]